MIWHPDAITVRSCPLYIPSLRLSRDNPWGVS
jgi:hypothetical protein